MKEPTECHLDKESWWTVQTSLVPWDPTPELGDN